MKQNVKNDDTQPNNYEINQIKHLIMKEISEKTELEEKIREIKDDLLQLKQEMGGLNATQHQQERYEKHIKILENRLDKANQKFNESIEYDKKLREEIDRLRKERFFFENIYKKLEKELEIIRKKISNNLEGAYDNYEQRDMNQEGFENLKAQMIKKESEYAKILSDIANDLNIRNSRKKSMEGKENYGHAFKGDEVDYNFKNYSKKLKSEQIEQQNENLQEKLQNLQFKFQKLEEFTEQKDVDSFCTKFKKNAQKNFDLFVVISSISKQAKQLESEIKEIEEEINGYKKFKNSKQGIEKNALISELKTKTQKLLHKQDKYENEFKKYSDEFKQISKYIYNLYTVLECDSNVEPNNKMQLESGVNETNVRVYLAEIESKLKLMQRYFEIERMGYEDDFNQKQKVIDKDRPTAKQISENMKNIFASMGKDDYVTSLFRDIENKNFRQNQTRT